jgi:hypothetical protein
MVNPDLRLDPGYYPAILACDDYKQLVKSQDTTAIVISTARAGRA